MRHSNGASSRGVARASALVVCAESQVEVMGVPDVQSSIGAAKDVDMPHPTTVPSSNGGLGVGGTRIGGEGAGLS